MLNNEIHSTRLIILLRSVSYSLITSNRLKYSVQNSFDII